MTQHVLLFGCLGKCTNNSVITTNSETHTTMRNIEKILAHFCKLVNILFLFIAGFYRHQLKKYGLEYPNILITRPHFPTGLLTT